MSLDFPLIRIDADRARAYVLAHGGTLEQARVAGILDGAAPDRTLRQALEQQQNPDGSFSASDTMQQSTRSDLSATAAMLVALRDLPPLAGSPMASRAVSFLRREQQPDGSWGPGDAYLTAAVGYNILAVEPGHTDPLLRAANWLVKTLDEEAAEQIGVPTLARTWAIWYTLLGSENPATLRAQSLILSRSLGCGALAVWLNCTLQVQAGGRLLLPLARRLADLADMQLPGGGWPEGLATTLAALRVFRGFAVI